MKTCIAKFESQIYTDAKFEAAINALRENAVVALKRDGCCIDGCAK